MCVCVVGDVARGSLKLVAPGLDCFALQQHRPPTVGVFWGPCQQGCISHAPCSEWLVGLLVLLPWPCGLAWRQALAFSCLVLSLPFSCWECIGSGLPREGAIMSLLFPSCVRELRMTPLISLQTTFGWQCYPAKGGGV